MRAGGRAGCVRAGPASRRVTPVLGAWGLRAHPCVLLRGGSPCARDFVRFAAASVPGASRGARGWWACRRAGAVVRVGGVCAMGAVRDVLHDARGKHGVREPGRCARRGGSWRRAGGRCAGGRRGTGRGRSRRARTMGSVSSGTWGVPGRVTRVFRLRASGGALRVVRTRDGRAGDGGAALQVSCTRYRGVRRAQGREDGGGDVRVVRGAVVEVGGSCCAVSERWVESRPARLCTVFGCCGPGRSPGCAWAWRAGGLRGPVRGRVCAGVGPQLQGAVWAPGGGRAHRWGQGASRRRGLLRRGRDGGRTGHGRTLREAARPETLHRVALRGVAQGASGRSGLRRAMWLRARWGRGEVVGEAAFSHGVTGGRACTRKPWSTGSIRWCARVVEGAA